MTFKLLWIIIGTFWLIISGILISNHYYAKWFLEGYKHGVAQEAAYILHTQPQLRGVVQFPSQRFQDCAWRLVNENENSSWIEVCEGKDWRKP